MTEQDFDREINYWLTMSYVKQLKSNGTISDEEYKQIDMLLLKKYRPILGTLLSENYF